MNKLIKFFPFMPAPKETGKLILAILFYLIVPAIVAGIIGFILGITIILSPLAFVVGLAATAYTIMGIVFAIMSFTGHDFSAEAAVEAPAEAVEEAAEEAEAAVEE